MLSSSKNNFFENYIEETYKVFNNLDLKLLEKITLIIEKKFNLIKASLFVVTEGQHLYQITFYDFNKGIKNTSNKTFNPKIISLSNSIEMITAIAMMKNLKKSFLAN